MGKWDNWYSTLDSNAQTGFVYGDLTTYLIASAFLADVRGVEDWGCGTGVFKKFCLCRYIGIDGSKTPFANRIVDLCTYRSDVDGILLRHVLEHNYQWEHILASAVQSFRRKLCLILFTPLGDQTFEIAHNRPSGVDVPDISFNRRDLEAYFEHFHWKLLENISTATTYGQEHVYFVWRSG
jgi:hypothetical protein